MNDSRLLLDLYASINVCMWLAYTYQISFKSNHPGAVMTSYRFLKMAAMEFEVLFRLRL